MGWAFCGKNGQTGEEMGYGVEGICAEPGCNAVIDHGLGCLCGEMHEDPETCQRYYCGEHLFFPERGRGMRCARCVDPVEDEDAEGEEEADEQES